MGFLGNVNESTLEFEWRRPVGGLDWLRLLLRLVLGGVFLFLGLQKAIDPVAFLKALREYDFTSTPWLLNSVAALLPWVEVVFGSLLILGVWVRATSILLAILVVSFSVVIADRAFAIYEAQSLAFCAIQFDCGCGTGVVYVCRKLAENGLLGIGAIVLTLTRPGN